jgi:hypothetical protein
LFLKIIKKGEGNKIDELRKGGGGTLRALRAHRAVPIFLMLFPETSRERSLGKYRKTLREVISVNK